MAEITLSDWTEDSASAIWGDKFVTFALIIFMNATRKTLQGYFVAHVCSTRNACQSSQTVTLKPPSVGMCAPVI
jgi:hypothetical protein